MDECFVPSLTLSAFSSTSTILSSQFKSQIVYPAFFETNLVDPQRVIMRFSDCPTNNGIRVFYFQLFKLCFEVKTKDLIYPRQYLQEFKTVVLDNKFMIKCNDVQTIQTQKLNNSMFKPLLEEFLNILVCGSISTKQPFNEVLSFTKIIMQHPILDNILLNVFKTFLKDFRILNRFQDQMPVGSILESLSRIFDLGITKINKCYRFDQADVFCYIDNEKQIFLASKDQLQNVQMSQNGSKLHQSNTLLYKNQYFQNKENINLNLNITPVKNSKKYVQASTSGIIEQQSSYLESQSKNQGVFSSESLEKVHQSSKSQTKQSPIQQFQLEKVTCSVQNVNEDFMNIFSKRQNQGTRYEDFTSTIILDIIQEPHRKNIRDVKDRAKQRKGIGPSMI